MATGISRRGDDFTVRDVLGAGTGVFNLIWVSSISYSTVSDILFQMVGSREAQQKVRRPNSIVVGRIMFFCLGIAQICGLNVQTYHAPKRIPEQGCAQALQSVGR